jgi:hypothetical protein
VIYFLEKLFKFFRRAVVLDCHANKPSRESLGEIVEPLEAMIEEMIEYALEHKSSQETLHRVFYERYRDQYPLMLTRVIKGSYRDAARRAKSFREAKKKSIAHTGKPEVRRVKIIYLNNQDWAVSFFMVVGMLFIRLLSGLKDICICIQSQIILMMRRSLMPRAPEVEVLYEGAQKGFGVPSPDGSLVPLGSLWGVEALDATELKPCGSRSKATQTN